MIYAIVGAGGKTGLLKEMADRFCREGKTVFVTTTTRMFIEEDTLLTDDAAVIIDALRKNGYAFAGIPEGEKIKALPEEVYMQVCGFADVVLVEADGSKHMPLKYPNATEPVIPENTDQIIVVWGPHGLGKPAREVCHRLELVTAVLGIGEDTVMTREYVKELLETGYRIPLRRQFPDAEIIFSPEL